MNYRFCSSSRVIGIGIFLLFWGGICFAGHITLQISTTPTPADQQIFCTVSIVNQGDESAANVQAHVEFLGKRYSAQVQPSLAVGQTYQGSYEMPATNLLPGRYSLIVIVEYTDTNGYPFTALSTANVPFREDFSPQIHGMTDAVELGGSAGMYLRLKNPQNQKQEVQVRLVLPKEISCDQPQREVSLAAMGEKEIGFDLRNFSALEGSTYQVFTLVEYAIEGKHTSMAIPGTIKIVPARSFFQKYRLWIISGTILLALAFAGIQIYGLLSRHRKSNPTPRKSQDL